MDTSKVTRLEVIGPTGREFTKWHIHSVELQLQDDGRTLKIFYGSDVKFDEDIAGVLSSGVSGNTTSAFLNKKN